MLWGVHRRSLRATKAGEAAAAVSPGTVWDEHSVLLLEGAQPLDPAVFTSLQAAISKVLSQALLPRVVQQAKRFW